jgi:hypothetical protein
MNNKIATPAKTDIKTFLYLSRFSTQSLADTGNQKKFSAKVRDKMMPARL